MPKVGYNRAANDYGKDRYTMSLENVKWEGKVPMIKREGKVPCVN